MTTIDTLAGIRPGLTADQVIAKLGPPGSTSSPWQDRALGCWTWHWEMFLPDNTLTVQLEAAREHGVFTVRAVIGKGLGIETDRGVEVGCSADDVRRAYPDVIFDEITNPHEDVFVMRSGELLFRFTNGAAAPIVLGTPFDASDLFPATFPAPPRRTRQAAPR